MTKILAIICNCLMLTASDAIYIPSFISFPPPNCPAPNCPCPAPRITAPNFPAPNLSSSSSMVAAPWKNVPEDMKWEIRELVSDLCFDGFDVLIEDKTQGFLVPPLDVIRNIRIVFTNDNITTIGILPTDAFKYRRGSFVSFVVPSIIINNGKCTLSTQPVLDGDVPLFAPEPRKPAPRIPH